MDSYVRDPIKTETKTNEKKDCAETKAKEEKGRSTEAKTIKEAKKGSAEKHKSSQSLTSYFGKKT